MALLIVRPAKPVAKYDCLAVLLTVKPKEAVDPQSSGDLSSMLTLQFSTLLLSAWHRCSTVSCHYLDPLFLNLVIISFNIFGMSDTCSRLSNEALSYSLARLPLVPCWQYVSRLDLI